MYGRYWGGQEMTGRMMLPVHTWVQELPFGLPVQSVPLQIKELMLNVLYLPSSVFAGHLIAGFLLKKATSFSLLVFFGPSLPHDNTDSLYFPAVSAFQGCWEDRQHLPVPPSPAGYHRADATALDKALKIRCGIGAGSEEVQAVENTCVWFSASCSLFPPLGVFQSSFKETQHEWFL